MHLNRLTDENEAIQSTTVLPREANHLFENDHSENERITAYLDDFERELGKGVPTALRRELREEVRQHIKDQVAACIELGDSEEQALESALSRFGEVAPLAQQFRHAHASREFRTSPLLFLGAPALWFGSLLTAGIASGLELATGATNIPALFLTLAFPLLYCLIYGYSPAAYRGPEHPPRPILVDLIFPALWYGGNFLAGLVQGGWSGAVTTVCQTPMPAALLCFSLGWLVTRHVSGRRKRLVAR